MNYKKILKKVFVGLTFYGFGELMFQVGKGQMLAVLSHYNTSANDMITILSEDNEKPFPIKVILGSCKLKQEFYSHKEES